MDRYLYSSELQTRTIEIEYYEGADVTLSTVASWIYNLSYTEEQTQDPDISKYVFQFTLRQNTGGYRGATINIKLDGGDFSKVINQSRPISPIYLPIYKDIIWNGGYATEDFEILLNNEVIYVGYTVPKPNGTVQIRFNDILENYINSDAELKTGTAANNLEDYEKTFLVKLYGSSQAFYITTWNSWREGIENMPISDKIGLDTPIAIANETFTIEVNGQRVYSEDLVTQEELLISLNDLKITAAEGSVVEVIDDGNDVLQHLIVGCKEYPYMLYLNRAGYYDVLVFEGNVFKTSSNGFKSINTGNNRTNYKNQVTESFTAYTGRLNKEQQKRVSEAMGTTKSWLYYNGERIPVNVTNTDFQEGNKGTVVEFNLQRVSDDFRA